MNNLIYQCHTGKMLPYITYSSDNFEEYAEKYGVEYILDYKPFIEKTYNFKSGIKMLPYYYEKLKLFTDPIYDEYDNILYVDTDILINDYSENIFEIPNEEVSLAAPLLMNGKHWYNTGVILTTKRGRQKMRDTFDWDWVSWVNRQPKQTLSLLTDENYLNTMFTIHNINVKIMDSRWNVWYRDRVWTSNPLFYHFSNEQKDYMEGFYFEHSGLE